MKVIPTTVLGSIISAIILGVGATVIVIVENTTGTLGMRGRGFWWLALMIGAVAGAFGGGIEGFVISYFRFSVLSTLLFGIGFGASSMPATMSLPWKIPFTVTFPIPASPLTGRPAES